mmetsp:Transcript_4308/g.12208  ORF Transcript_4308/g.12208 Transcript_4308/m.12208 type:complete len:381 (+) Transcript_4308:63-1205(+)
MFVLRAALAASALLVVEARLGTPEAAPELCAEALVRETCALFGAPGNRTTAAAVGGVLAATEESAAGFWAAARLPDGPASCADVCAGAVAYLLAVGRAMPPASDTGCYGEGGEVVCDVDLAPRTIGKIAAKSAGDFAYAKGFSGTGEAEVQNMTGKEQAVEVKAKAFDYSAEDIAVRVAQLFRIYPAPGGEMEVDELHLAGAAAKAFGSTSERALVQKRLGESQAYVNVALRTFAAGGTGAEVTKWFGADALTYEPARKQIVSVLNSISNVLGHSHVAEGSSCKSQVFAYVYPCRPNPLEKDLSGRYYLFVCDMFFSVQEEQICTLVHESSHHSTACTKDLVYGTRACMQLAKASPTYALYNADNYGYYIREVAWGHGTF